MKGEQRERMGNNKHKNVKESNDGEERAYCCMRTFILYTRRKRKTVKGRGRKRGSEDSPADREINIHNKQRKRIPGIRMRATTK